jgi:hypothetical protein
MMAIGSIIMIFSNTSMTLIAIIAMHDYDSTLSIDSHPFLRAPSLQHFIPLQYPHCHIRLFHQLRNRQLHPLAGRTITQYIQQLMRERKEPIPAEVRSLSYSLLLSCPVLSSHPTSSLSRILSCTGLSRSSKTRERDAQLRVLGPLQGISEIR